jgi:hypothetical protein
MMAGLCIPDQILASPKVTQVAHLESPTYEVLDVCAIEEYDRFPRIEIFADALRTRIFSLEVGHSSPLHFQPQPDFWYSNGFLRFAILHIPQFPDPLIVVIGVGPGATDVGFESYVIAEINGQFTVLNSEPSVSSLQGGLYIGYLNDEFGYGIASWNRMLEGEANFMPHRYTIHIFSWNEQAASLHKRKSIMTEEQYADWHDALAAYHLHIANLIDTIIGDDHSTLGIEHVIEKAQDIPQAE